MAKYHKVLLIDNSNIGKEEHLICKAFFDGIHVVIKKCPFIFKQEKSWQLSFKTNDFEEIVLQKKFPNQANRGDR